ncbi:MAG: hypothetical protein NTY37_09150 [Methanothrix sp.]|nr:hypothetical protein [Methanothrix sp.]
MKKVSTLMNMREVVITHGQTEASPGITMSSTDDSLEQRVSTIGRPMPHTEMKTLPVGEGCRMILPFLDPPPKDRVRVCIYHSDTVNVLSFPEALSPIGCSINFLEAIVNAIW